MNRANPSPDRGMPMQEEEVLASRYHSNPSLSMEVQLEVESFDEVLEEPLNVRPSLTVTESHPSLSGPSSDAEIEFPVNYGSESDWSDSEDESLVPPVLTRVYQGTQDTPIDDEGPEGEAIVISPLAADAEGAVRPNDFFHFEWRNFPDPPIPQNERREAFTQVGVGPAKKCQDPYTIFVSIWNRDIMERIMRETNKYAQDLTLKMMSEGTLCPRSRITEWTDTTVDELYVYFGIILAMGIIVKSKLEEYWSTDAELFSTPYFRAHMKLNRFQLLNTCLHFNDNAGMPRNLSGAEAKLFKIEPLISHLNARFQAMYTMGQNIALDESLMQWKGWLSINQFISNKAAKVGVKTYELCESQTGYLWRFDVHAKKHNSLDQQNPLDAFTPSIVLKLLRDLEGRGYTVWMDNFYNSPGLARQLKVLGFDVVGTLRTNRQFVPQELNDLTKQSMRKGQITGCTSGDVDIMVWRDENRVATISTYHGNETAVVNNVVKPCLIVDYNIMMGGVDKKDQLLSMYPIERKRTSIWYKKFFKRLLNVSTLNSYIISKKSGSSWDHRRFRKELVNQILSWHSEPRQVPVSKPGSEVYLARYHHPLPYPIGKCGARLRRVCAVCKKRTNFYCVGCNKAVCLRTCFVSLH